MGQKVGDRRVESRGEGRGCGLKEENQNVDLPDLRHDGQKQCDARADHVHADQEGPARQPVGEAADDRRDPDIGDHLDRQRGPEHRARSRAGKLEGEQAESDRQQPRPEERDHLGREQVAIDSVGEDFDHCLRCRCLLRCRSIAGIQPPLSLNTTSPPPAPRAMVRSA
jgi:hypothetical protein